MRLTGLCDDMEFFLVGHSGIYGVISAKRIVELPTQRQMTLEGLDPWVGPAVAENNNVVSFHFTERLVAGKEAPCLALPSRTGLGQLSAERIIRATYMPVPRH